MSVCQQAIRMRRKARLRRKKTIKAAAIRRKVATK